MPFSSLLFLSVFFPLYVVLTWATPRAARNVTVLVLSILFYAWGAPRFLPVVLTLGIVDWFIALQIDRRRATPAARWILTFAVTMHLSVLAYFKYSNFFVGELGSLLTRAGRAPFSWKDVALPIGVSFLTFEEISYVVDVYRGEARPSRSVPRYLLFLMLFPHSIAGPIFRWKDLEAQLVERNERIDDVVRGITRFVWGLAKKILVADAAAIAADGAFSHGATEVTAGVAWLGAFAYAIQIFYDFSGYSDMAIGLGRIAGFRFKENFDDPYISGSITEFWTRWHMSLSRWLRDYLYIPLGGNRHGELRTRLNVCIVFVLSGLWHGASWTFVLWGAYHAFFSVLERTRAGMAWRRAPRAVGMPLTFAIVVIGWVFFRATSIEQAFGFIRAMAGLGVAGLEGAKQAPAELLPNRSIAFLVLGFGFVLVRAIFGRADAEGRWRHAYSAAAPVLLLLCVLQIVNTKFVPLIYFKF